MTRPTPTPAQVAALTAAAQGLTQDTAARQLGIGERTLRRHQLGAQQALGARSLIHAVALAVAHGLIDPQHLDNRTRPTQRKRSMPEPTTPTPVQVLATPMDANDANADTIRGYLVALLATLWEEGAEFSGKHPFGNSGWEWYLYAPLVKAGHITGRFDEDGDLENADEQAGDQLIASAIQALGQDTR